AEPAEHIVAVVHDGKTETVADTFGYRKPHRETNDLRQLFRAGILEQVREHVHDNVAFLLRKHPVVKYRLERQVNVQLCNTVIEPVQAGRAAERVGIREFTPEVRIQVKATVPGGREGTRQVLRPLDARVP